MSPRTSLRMLLWLIMATAAAACANMGRPEGGAIDTEPPVYTHSTPRPGERNVSRTRMSITFNENVQLEDAFNKVVVSPPQKTPPTVTANGRTVTVAFRDTLLPATTYTVDFADAIKDLNEGNVIDGFALDFSTGSDIDTLRISGMVLQADNLEPAQGMLVGVYSDLSDTALTTVPMQRIARTNQLGQFTIRNLPDGLYRIFAIDDVNRDYHWDRSEDIAFYDSLIRPATEPIAITDTLYSSTGADSLVQRHGIRYLPNDILLSRFNTGYRAPYLADYKRPERNRLTLSFGAPQDSLPTLAIAGGAPGIGSTDRQWALRQANTTGDTLVYWLRDSTVIDADSLLLSVKYIKLDTLEQRVWATDTLRFFFRDPGKKKDKKKDRDRQDSAPAFTVDSITGDTTYLPPADMEYINITVAGSMQQELARPLTLQFPRPVLDIDSKGVHLSRLDDTTWVDAGPAPLIPDSLSPLMLRQLDIPWQPGAKYRLDIDTLAITDIYGHHNRPFRHDFTVKATEDYANLHLTLPGLDSIAAIVQLLSSSDNPVYQAVKAPGKSGVGLTLLAPDTYYLRLIIDSNQNGKWDTGDPIEKIHPEEVYYFAKKLQLRKNWDVEQTWDIYELPLDRQKPYAIKKNKPKLKRGEQPPVDPDDNDQYQDGTYDPFTPGSANRRGSNTSGRRNANNAVGLKRNNTLR